MCSTHVEWLSVEDIADGERPNYWKAEHLFIPFAQNGAGDVWCWYPAWSANSQAPVVLAHHDENAAEGFAPSFEGFLLRQLLQTFAEIYEDNADFSRDELQQTARAELKTLRPYLRDSWHALLSEIAARPLQRNESWGCVQFLTRDEAKQIVERELAFEHLNQEFAHMA